MTPPPPYNPYIVRSCIPSLTPGVMLRKVGNMNGESLMELPPALTVNPRLYSAESKPYSKSKTLDPKLLYTFKSRLQIPDKTLFQIQT